MWGWSDAGVGCRRLNNFGYPAARVRPGIGSSIVPIGDLLQGIIKEVNPAAEKMGLKNGMTGKEALDLL